MPEIAIDVNRGAMLRPHPTGIRVWMYPDDPGTYYNDHGHEVPTEIAKDAGYDVIRDTREKVKRQRMREYETEIHKELNMEIPDVTVVIKERNGWKLLEAYLDRVNIQAPEGYNVNPIPLAKAQGEMLFEKFAGAPVTGHANKKQP